MSPDRPMPDLSAMGRLGEALGCDALVVLAISDVDPGSRQSGANVDVFGVSAPGYAAMSPLDIAELLDLMAGRIRRGIAAVN